MMMRYKLALQKRGLQNKWRSKPEVGLANIKWVIVDEADVLFGKFI